MMREPRSAAGALMLVAMLSTNGILAGCRGSGTPQAVEVATSAPERTAGEPFETKPDADIEKAIVRAAPDYNRKLIGEDGQRARYVYGRVDLNGDERDEVWVYLLGSIFCGTGGCDLLLLTEAGEGYALVNRFSISRVPVIVSAKRTAGWNDLSCLQSGGGAPASYVTYVFDGKKYVEQERVPADRAPQGRRYLAGDLTYDDGIPLEPRD